jgi:hypothetical protein
MTAANHRGEMALRSCCRCRTAAAIIVTAASLLLPSVAAGNHIMTNGDCTHQPDVRLSDSCYNGNSNISCNNSQ